MASIVFSGTDAIVTMTFLSTSYEGWVSIKFNNTYIYQSSFALNPLTPDIPSGFLTGIATISLASIAVNGVLPTGTYTVETQAKFSDNDIQESDEISYEAIKINPCLQVEIDCASPKITVKDVTNWAVNGYTAVFDNEIIHKYPQGSGQTDGTTTGLTYTTNNVWEGANQFVLEYEVTYTKEGFSQVVSGFINVPRTIKCEGICDLYCCLEAMRKKVEYAKSKNRSDYQRLQIDYSYAVALAKQYTEAVRCLEEVPSDLVATIKSITGCNGKCGDCKDCGDAPKKVLGLGAAGAGGDGYIDDVELDGNYLIFTGVGNGYDGAVNLTPLNNYVANVQIISNELRFTGVGLGFDGLVNLSKFYNLLADSYRIESQALDFTTSNNTEIVQSYVTTYSCGNFTQTTGSLTCLLSGVYYVGYEMHIKNTGTQKMTIETISGLLNSSGSNLNVQGRVLVNGVLDTGSLSSQVILGGDFLKSSFEQANPAVEGSLSMHTVLNLSQNDTITLECENILGRSSEVQLFGGRIIFIRIDDLPAV